MTRPAFLFLLLAGAMPAVQAKLAEEVIEVPVTVADMYGKSVTMPIVVTVFSDDRNPRPAPVLVLNHGRAAEAPDRAELGRARYSEVSRFFVRQGFIVAVPTRVGYGVTAGPDVEYSGPCEKKNYPPGYKAAAEQALAALAVVRERPDAARDRTVMLGQSYGGVTAIGVAALGAPGVQVAINFAGGGGGSPKLRPQQPCQPQQMERLFRDYGRGARIPTLWIYTENDSYLGAEYPRQWHAAFAQAGGRSEFVQYPPHGEDGHSLLTRHPKTWQPKVLEFLRANGYAVKPETP
ncbi:MAG TPA: dienelactone hydrolase [Ramlibacter sp.]|nr:dienelactone hydrolase [Ramlibacter sp.]